MTISVNMRQRQGVLTMPSNYRPLTGHKPKPIRSRSPRAPSKSPPTVPNIGLEVAFDITLVTQDINADTGLKGTPLSKIRWFEDIKKWKQVGRHEAGMLVFFQNEPTNEHTSFIIRSIIPSQTAGYADLI